MRDLKKLAIVTTHPIQYNAPLFRLLHERGNIEIKVFYTWSQSEAGVKYDPGFNKQIEWDIPLLEGYPFVFVENISEKPGSHYFRGIDNPLLIKKITEWKADAVLVYGWNFKSHLKAMQFFKGKIPVFFRGDSTLLDEQKGIRKIFRTLFLRFIYKNINVALYAGQSNKAYFEACGLKDTQLVFMPHAVENSRFGVTDLIQEQTTFLIKELSIADDEIVFLFAGKLEKKKQPDMLAEAFDELSLKNAHLIIAGSGELEKSMKHNFSHNKNIHFTGFVNQSKMPALYAACNVFILPSKGPGETWGLAINEAMAAGKAIISSTACGASADLLHNGVNGFIFDKNDRASLKEHLLYFVKNPDNYLQMGTESKRIIENYSYTNDCLAVESVLLRVTK